MLDWLAENWKDVALIATSLVTAASVIVRLTPTKADDAVLDKIMSFLKIIALTPKDEKIGGPGAATPPISKAS